MKRPSGAAALLCLSLALPASAGPLVTNLSLELPLTPDFLMATTELSPTARTEQQKTLFGLPLNEGPVDRILRGVLAGALAGIGGYRLYNDSPNSTLSYLLVGVAAVPAATGAVGYCPLYHLLGVDYTF